MIRSLTLLCLLGSEALAQSTYELTEVVLPAPAESAWAAGIDERGNVLLRLYSTGVNATLWVVGPDGVRQLPTAPAPAPLANDLADSGRVLGSMFSRPFVWDPCGTPRPLRPCIFGDVNEVVAGNSAGLLVGYCYKTGGYEGGPVYPLLWQGNALILLPMPGASSRAAVADINEKNQMVGGAVTQYGQHAFSWSGWISDGIGMPIEIGAPPGHHGTSLSSINVAGECVGSSSPDTGGLIGMRWLAGTFTLVPEVEELYEIARDGTALGLRYVYNPHPVEPYVSRGASAWPLQTLLDPVSGAGWDLVYAADLNESGQIACTAFDPHGEQRVCILTPLGESMPTKGVARRERTPEQNERAQELVDAFEARRQVPGIPR